MRRSVLLSLLIVTIIAVKTVAADPLNVDFRALVSRADLDYTTPATRSEEGQPLGNGRMGSLVWTTPSALHFQINRVDVFAEDSYTASFPKQDSDYASGCGYVDINLSDAGDDLFTNDNFNQHLSLYDATMTAKGRGVTARLVPSSSHDVIAVEIDDQRDQPAAINVDLRMLRYAIQNISGKNFELAKNHTVEFRTAEQIASSKLDIRDGRIALTQQFSEHDFYDSSAVAIGIIGRPSRARYLNESTVQISAAAARGKFTILIASAASFKSNEDTAAIAMNELAAVEPGGFEAISSDTQSWWHDFWSRGFVHMHSPDAQADFVEANYTYFLYIMASSSRGGAFPPRFGGMLWYTNGDMRRWGSQYWWANTNAYYSNLMPANRLDLMDPMFTMYSNMTDACALAAQQQWGAQGIWIPEITFFNGPEKLPDDIAAELQELMLTRKSYDDRSAKFQYWAETKNRHNARWNFLADGYWDHGHYIVPTKGAGIFGHCTHILCDAARIGSLFFQRYQFTLDKDQLRAAGYPIIRGAAEFYRTFPNVQRGPDGKFHILHINNNENGWDSNDAPMEINGMRLAFTTAIDASMALDTDADLRLKWQEMLDNLAPPKDPGRGKRPRTPTGGDAGTPGGTSTAPTTQYNDVPGRPSTRPFGAFVYGGPGAIAPNDPDAAQKKRFLGFNALGSFIDTQGSGGAQIFRNRLRLREGPGAIDCEHLGGLTAGIHSTLLNSTEDDNGKAEIEAFAAAWPRSWDCSFQLLAHGGFVISASLKDRKIRFVQIHSPLGGSCRLKNPWPDSQCELYRNGAKADSTNRDAADVIAFDTNKGDTILLVPSGTSPEKLSVTIPN